MGRAPNKLPTGLLKDVSRSFYLTLRVLPGSIRHQIGLAYLLARTTDTIADTELVPVEKRLSALDALRQRISGKESDPVKFEELVLRAASPAECTLLEQCEASIALLQNLSVNDRLLVREVLDTIISGQELDLRRFSEVAVPSEPVRALVGNRMEYRPKTIVALPTETELDDYTYRVAGCVGEFWTKMCRAHVFPNAPLADAKLLADGIRFGKGLQLVNILRDLPADLHKGRCYLPADDLAKLGLTPADLLNPASESKLRPLCNDWLDRAEEHLAAGWTYTNSLPWSCIRVRLACAWPILIGLETIARLRTAKVLDV